MDNEYLINLSRKLVEDILESLYIFCGEIDWWKDEPRCSYQRDYNLLCAQIKTLEDLLK